MGQIKFVQTWDTVAGRKQEYAAFFSGEFLPAMKAAGLTAETGWYTLLGGGPHIVVESLPGSLQQVEAALENTQCREMLTRFNNLVSGYANGVLGPAPWEIDIQKDTPDPGGARLVLAWDVLRGRQEDLSPFFKETLLPEMALMGLATIESWVRLVGSGPQFVLEARAPDISALFNAVREVRCLSLIVKMEELISRYEIRVMVRHQGFLDAVHDAYGRAIRGVQPDEMYSMVGPMGA